MAKRRSSRWITIVLMMAFILGACDSETPTATPDVSNNNNQATITPAGITQVETSTPATESTVEVSRQDTATPDESALIGTPLPTLPPPTPEPPRAPSSLDKIGAALDAGTLDADTAMVYQLYAYYLPDKLPAEYQGDDSEPFPEPTVLFGQLSERMSSLPAYAQAEFKPFFLRPDDSESYWYQTIAQSTNTTLRGSGLAALASPDYKPKDTAHIRVWYDGNSATATQKAIALAAEIDRSRMWDKEKTAMLNHEPCSDEGIVFEENGSPKDYGGDGRLDLYLVPQHVIINRPDASGAVPEGATRSLIGVPGITIQLGPYKGCPVATFLIVDIAQDNKEMRATVAHELFHAFGDSFKHVEGRLRKYDWWIEASATWAEDLVYPTNAPDGDSEWDLLKDNWAFRPEYDGPLDAFRVYREEDADNTSLPQYASYLWPFYLRQAAGGDETVIGEMWERSETKIPIEVFGSEGDWNERFKEFALWNWNRESVFQLTDAGYMDAGRRVGPLYLGQNPVTATIALRSHPQYTTDVDQPHASVRYYQINIVDVGEQGTNDFVNQVHFDFAGLNGNRGLGIQAIIQYVQSRTVATRYDIEDWSELSEKTICREVRAVSSVVLVVTNSSVDQPQAGPIKVEGLNTQCPKEASYTFNMVGRYSVDKPEPLQEKGSAIITQTLASYWEIAFVKHQDATSSYTDVTSYVFTATNSYGVIMGGSYASSNLFDKVNATLKSSGSDIYINHKPPIWVFTSTNKCAINKSEIAKSPPAAQQGGHREPAGVPMYG